MPHSANAIVLYSVCQSLIALSHLRQHVGDLLGFGRHVQPLGKGLLLTLQAPTQVLRALLRRRCLSLHLLDLAAQPLDLCLRACLSCG